MRASIPTLLSLEQFAQVLGLDPLHFAQGFSALRPQQTQCNDVWYQYQWQDPGKASREDIALLIDQAEHDISEQVGFWLAPTWTEDERHALRRGGAWQRGQHVHAVAKWGHFIYGGIRAATAISAATVTRLANVDADNDGFSEVARFTITGVPSTWDLCEIRACFKEYVSTDKVNDRTDMSSTGYDVSWEVRPLRAEWVGATVYVYIPVWHLFRPDLVEQLGPDPIDADDANSYVDTLSFYRVYNDTCTQAQFLWGEEGCYDPGCAWTIQDGCLRSNDKRNSTLTASPGTCDPVTGEYSSTGWSEGLVPNVMRMWYKSGLAWQKCGVMQYQWARLVVMLACARLELPVCTCSQAKLLVEAWRQLFNMTTPDKGFTLTPDMLGNPFGVHMGEIAVWKQLQVAGRRRGRAVQT